MTEFKPGDKVVGYGLVTGRQYVGTLDYQVDKSPEVWALRDVVLAESEGKAASPNVVNIRLYEEKPDLSFVGPRPEPGPIVTLPFKLGGNDYYPKVQDANGHTILLASGEPTTAEQDKEMAKLVVRLLNEHFEKEAQK